MRQSVVAHPQSRRGFPVKRKDTGPAIVLMRMIVTDKRLIPLQVKASLSGPLAPAQIIASEKALIFFIAYCNEIIGMVTNTNLLLHEQTNEPVFYQGSHKKGRSGKGVSNLKYIANIENLFYLMRKPWPAVTRDLSYIKIL